MTGKRALLEMLKAEGVEYIFGNPGTSEGPIIDLLGDYPEFRYILALQESVAVGMAESYARSTGTASFVSLHVDSGLANGIALMLDAYNTGTPMVVTSANYDARKITEVKTDLAELVRPVTITRRLRFALQLERRGQRARTHDVERLLLHGVEGGHAFTALDPGEVTVDRVEQRLALRQPQRRNLVGRSKPFDLEVRCRRIAFE